MSNNRERQGGIVPGFANSKTAFTVIEHVDENVIHVIYSKQFENSSTEKMVSHTWNLIKQFKLNDKATSKVFVDASKPGFIRSILITLGEFQNYEVWVEKSKRDNIPLYKLMHIVPVSFTGEKHKLMLGNCKKLLDKGVIAIEPDVHKDLIQELRLAAADEEMSLDKKEFSFDLLDSFRLACEFIKY
jgi:hypothetical protein